LGTLTFATTINVTSSNALSIGSGSGTQLFNFDTTGAVNGLTFASAGAGSGPTILAAGSNTNIDLTLTPKGTGQVDISTFGTAGLVHNDATGLLSTALLSNADITPSLDATNISGVGTLTDGVWNASTIGVAYGGTGIQTTVPNQLFAGGTTATGAFQQV